MSLDMHLLRSLFLFVLPGTLFSIAVYVQLLGDLPEPWQPFLTLFPYLAIVAGASMAWRFNRSRVIWAIAVLVLVERSLFLSTSFWKEYLLQLMPLLVPVNLVLYCWWSERGLMTLHGLTRLLLLLAQVGLVAWLFYSSAGEVIALLERPLMPGIDLGRLKFSQISLVVIVSSLMIMIIRFWQRPEAIEGSFFWVLAAVVIGLHWPEEFLYWVGVAAFLFLLAIIESSFKMAFNDELTGLPARRAMNEYLLKVGRRYTIAMVDVDHFKKVNDTYGHDVGDQVLKMVATCLRRVTGGGRAYRYGGEEFTVIFPSKDSERALPHLEALRENIEESGFTVRSKKRPKKKPEKPNRKTSGKSTLRVTVSVGVASRDEKRSTPEELIKAADQALYKAKKSGRNQVCLG